MAALPAPQQRLGFTCPILSSAVISGLHPNFLKTGLLDIFHIPIMPSHLNGFQFIHRAVHRSILEQFITGEEMPAPDCHFPATDSQEPTVCESVCSGCFPSAESHCVLLCLLFSLSIVFSGSVHVAVSVRLPSFSQLSGTPVCGRTTFCDASSAGGHLGCSTLWLL